MKTTTLNIGGLVLCGGDSRRMGQSKVWLELSGQTILERVVDTVFCVTSDIVVATRRGVALPTLSTSVRYSFDNPQHAGPLAGIAAGMTLLSPTCDVVVVAACDHPLVQASFLESLIDTLGDAPAVVPQYEDNVYPLLAVYRMSTLAILMAQLARGNFRAMDFVHACGARILDATSMTPKEACDISLKNVNTPADWQDIQTIANRA